MLTHRKHKMALILGAVSATGAMALQPPAVNLPQPLTLQAAIRTALDNHNRIGIARSQKEAAEQRVTQARSACYPHITPSYEHSSQRTSFDTGSGTQTGTITRNNTAINLTQTLYDSGKREINVARSRDAVRAADYGVQDTTQAVILNVTTSWYELLRSKELVRVAESGVERAGATLESTRAFVEAGSSPRKDVLQAQADDANARVQAIQARNNVLLAETALRNAMGVTEATPIATPDEAVSVPADNLDPGTAACYLEQAYANRPDLKQSEANLTATRRSVRLARIEAGPQITSTVSGGYRIDPDPGNEEAFLVGVSYPLFDGGASRAAVREARASVLQAEQQLELSRQDIAASVESAFLLREEARARITASQAAVSAARENYAAASASRAEGAGTILDVITAQNQLVTAETSTVQAIYDFHTAQAQLDRAVGANDHLTTGEPEL